MDPRNWIILGLIIAIIGAGWGVKHYAEAYYDFVAQTKANGEQAIKEKDRTEKAWEQKLLDVEAQYEETRQRNAANFAAELARLRAQRTASGSLPENPHPVGVCFDEAGNRRLSAALSEFRQGIVGILGACQENTDKLIACQGYVRSITEALP